MSCYWEKARHGRLKALETLAARRIEGETGFTRSARRSRRSPLAQAIYASEMTSRSSTGLVH